jgi:hypothetical protein
VRSQAEEAPSGAPTGSGAWRVDRRVALLGAGALVTWLAGLGFAARRVSELVGRAPERDPDVRFGPLVPALAGVDAVFYVSDRRGRAASAGCFELQYVVAPTLVHPLPADPVLLAKTLPPGPVVCDLVGRGALEALLEALPLEVVQRLEDGLALLSYRAEDGG